MNSFFNAHHSPIGAFASFTLGFPGAKGGLGLELGGPADQSIYIGMETESVGGYRALPFFEGAADEQSRYTGTEKVTDEHDHGLTAYPLDSIQRTFRCATDSWAAEDLRFTIYSPVRSIPDPATATDDELQSVLAPLVLAEMTIDNTGSSRDRRGFFGLTGNDRYSTVRLLDHTVNDSFTGIAEGRRIAIAASRDEATSGLGFDPEGILKCSNPETLQFGLGGTGLVMVNAPAGKVSTFRFVICFCHNGIVTTGIDAVYYYTKWFRTVEDVAEYGLAHFDALKQASLDADAMVENSRLSEIQKLTVAHTIRSYYGSTELLNYGGEPFWVVNEGEYRMMNTFDLAVDQLFFEMRMNPWTVRNELELFADRYSYTDTVRFPGDTQEYPGGISFTHDMGVANAVSRPHYSCYEISDRTECFSYMTHEQLVNWILCAAVYGAYDRLWLQGRLQLLQQCLQSMLNRDNPDPAMRTGLMGLDSSRCGGGAEITTYDSLDVSLGQSRNNIYLGGKCWAAYVAMERIFRLEGQEELARVAADQADRCAATITAGMTEEGFIPAVLNEGNHPAIIPAIEGLIFPLLTGCDEALEETGRFGEYIRALHRHLDTVMKPGVCLFADGGWKLSSTSVNSWLSKIYLCQHVARVVFGMPWDDAEQRSDATHWDWITGGEKAYYAWSDQVWEGDPRGSLYYPRGVTSALWLKE